MVLLALDCLSPKSKAQRGLLCFYKKIKKMKSAKKALASHVSPIPFLRNSLVFHSPKSLDSFLVLRIFRRRFQLFRYSGEAAEAQKRPGRPRKDFVPNGRKPS